MVLKRWLHATLVSDVTLAALAPGGVWEGVAPKGTATPHIVWTPINPGSDVAFLPAIRAMTQFLYQVTAWITGNDYAVLDPIIVRIDTLLNGASGAASGGHVIGCVRVGIVEPPANLEADGRMYRQAGGEYRLWATAT
jgi:hypothetical protein